MCFYAFFYQDVLNLCYVCSLAGCPETWAWLVRIAAGWRGWSTILHETCTRQRSWHPQQTWMSGPSWLWKNVPRATAFHPCQTLKWSISLTPAQRRAQLRVSPWAWNSFCPIDLTWMSAHDLWSLWMRRTVKIFKTKSTLTLKSHLSYLKVEFMVQNIICGLCCSVKLLCFLKQKLLPYMCIDQGTNIDVEQNQAFHILVVSSTCCHISDH